MEMTMLKEEKQVLSTSIKSYKSMLDTQDAVERISIAQV
jgi:hypothetical protein